MVSGERRPVAPVVVPRWVQLALLPVGILALFALARAAGTVLLVFVVANRRIVEGVQMSGLKG